MARKLDYHLDIPVILLILTNCQMELGNNDEAKVTFEKCLNSYESDEVYGKERKVGAMFELEVWRGRIDRDYLFGQLCALHQTLCKGEDYFNFARILHYLALESWNSEELGAAERLFRESLAMKRRILGPKEDDASVSLTLYSLAGVLKDRRMLLESEGLYRECLEIDRRSHGNMLSHSDIVATLYEL